MVSAGRGRRRLDLTHEYLTVPHGAITAQAVTYILAGVSQTALDVNRRDLDRRIARLAVPALGAILAEPLYNLADTAIVGHLGRSPLDALAIATSALSIVAWLAIFLSTATTTEVARNAAQGRHGAAGRAVGAAYSVAAGWGAVTSVVVILIAPLIVGLLGGRAGIGSAATGYIRISALGLPFLYLSYAGNGHLIGLENTRTPLLIAVAANVVNVALEIAFVFGLHAGLAGSAWGTVTAQALAAAAYGYASRRSPYPPGRPARGDIAAVLRDGHRLSVRTIALGVVPLAATAVTARLGPVPLAGQQIAYRLWAMLSLATDALAVPAQVFISAELGRGDRAAAERAARRTLVLGLAFGCALAALTAALALFAPTRRCGTPRSPGCCGPRPPSRSPRSRSSTTASSSALATTPPCAARCCCRSWPSRRSPAWCSGSTGSACPACGPRSAAGSPPGPSCSGGAGPARTLAPVLAPVDEADAEPVLPAAPPALAAPAVSVGVETGSVKPAPPVTVLAFCERVSLE